MRHDWVHGWQEVLDRAGLPSTTSMRKRKRPLRHPARMYQKSTAVYSDARSTA
jgi:hypothetical protein